MDQLFVGYGLGSKGNTISQQTIARWIVACITTAHAAMKRPLLRLVKHIRQEQWQRQILSLQEFIDEHLQDSKVENDTSFL